MKAKVFTGLLMGLFLMSGSVAYADTIQMNVGQIIAGDQYNGCTITNNDNRTYNDNRTMVQETNIGTYVAGNNYVDCDITNNNNQNNDNKGPWTDEDVQNASNKFKIGNNQYGYISLFDNYNNVVTRFPHFRYDSNNISYYGDDKGIEDYGTYQMAIGKFANYNLVNYISYSQFDTNPNCRLQLSGGITTGDNKQKVIQKYGQPNNIKLTDAKEIYTYDFKANDCQARLYILFVNNIVSDFNVGVVQ